MSEYPIQPTSMETERLHTSGVYGKRELTIVRGNGAHLWDEEGRRFVDCVAGIGVANLGHCHPAVVEALTTQAQRLITCPETFFNDVRARLLRELSMALPPGLDRFFLCNSGTEAVEGCLKFARLSTRRTQIVAAKRSFHGRTFGALSATHKARFREPFEPLVPGFCHARFNSLEDLEELVDQNTAAVLIEAVQGEGGVRPAEPGYLEFIRHLCDERGALLIVDEVQTGFGRTGRWFAFQHAGIVPDMVAMGKAIAGGLPMGAIGIGPRVTGLTPGVHGSTFGGNPLACAAALASLRALREERLVERSEEMGAYFREGLRRIPSSLVREVRGLGMMLGVELRIRVEPLLRQLEERGVLALMAGSTVLRFLPPLMIRRQDIDLVVARVEEVLAETEVESRGRQE